MPGGLSYAVPKFNINHLVHSVKEFYIKNKENLLSQKELTRYRQSRYFLFMATEPYHYL